MKAIDSKNIPYDFLLIFLLVSRFLSETVTNFIWKPANHVWSVLFLMSVPILLWPLLVLKGYDKENIFSSS